VVALPSPIAYGRWTALKDVPGDAEPTEFPAAVSTLV
jgi:hypothetical protein